MKINKQKDFQKSTIQKKNLRIFFLQFFIVYSLVRNVLDYHVEVLRHHIIIIV